MVKGIQCPYYVNKTEQEKGKSRIRCKCGEVSMGIRNSTSAIEIHFNKFCNNKYTACHIYKELREVW
jgi:hypothetical protein